MEFLQPAKQPLLLDDHRISKNANNNNNAPPDELNYPTTHDSVYSNSHPCNDFQKLQTQPKPLHLVYTNSTSIKAKAEFRSPASPPSRKSSTNHPTILDTFLSDRGQSTPWRVSHDLEISSWPVSPVSSEFCPSKLPLRTGNLVHSAYFDVGSFAQTFPQGNNFSNFFRVY